MPLYYCEVGKTIYPVRAKNATEAAKKLRKRLIKHMKEIEKALRLTKDGAK